MDRYSSYIYTKYDELDHDLLMININKAKKDKKNYPQIHIAPKTGLLNDPNGLVYYNGKYHIFYQICPNGPFHGMKSWNLITTVDFINYIDHGVILHATEEYENFGIFSGGAVVIEDNLCLLYTGNYRDSENNYKRSAYQIIAKLDNNYKVLSKRVIREPNMKLHTEHFRDPVAIGEFNILIGMQDLNKQGQIGIIKYSKKNYEGESKLVYLKNQFNLKGFMFECPNLFKLEGYDILIFSPQGVKSENKYAYKNIHDVVYSISDQFDVEKASWDSTKVTQLDYGFDFYAPQVFSDGIRTFIIGWLGVPDTIYPGDEKFMWSQMLTTIRELSVKQGRLYQKPISEYEKLENKWLPIETVLNVDSRVFKIKFKSTSDFSLSLGNEKYQIKLFKQSNDIILDRSNCQFQVNDKYGTKRYVKVEEKQSDIEIIVDMSCIEIFINGGKYVMTSRFFIDDITHVSVNGMVECKLANLKSITIIDGKV